MTDKEKIESTIHTEYGVYDASLEIDHKGRMFFMSTPKDKSHQSDIVIFPINMVTRVKELCEYWLKENEL